MSDCHKLARSGSTPTQLTSEGVRALVDHVASLRVLKDGERAQIDHAEYREWEAAIKAGTETRESLSQWLQTIGSDRLHDLIQLVNARSKGDQK